MEKSRVEWILRYGLGEVSTLPPRLSRIEKLLVELIRKGSGSDITVDDELSPTSENPVQNKVLDSIINGTGSGSVYSKIMLAIAEVVAEAPEDFDTLKEISDWISHHEDSAAAMNTAIQQNTTAIAGKVDKVSGKGLSTNDYTTEEKTKLASISANVSDVGQLYPNSDHGEIFNDYEGNVASGWGSHSEGVGTTASGPTSHAEGNSTTASSSGAHAEGGNTTASGIDSHAEGYTTIASGRYSHAEGMGTSATGECSHSEGLGTWACGEQHVQGRYNKQDTSCKYSFIIGNGTDDLHRSDAFAVGWNGLIYQNNSETGVDLNNKVDKVSGKGLSTEDYTTAEKTKLAGLQNYDDTSILADLDNKVDKVAGKGLSTKDYTMAEKNKLAGIETGANKTVVDSALSSSSTNPVQNKVIKESLDNKSDMNAVGLRLVSSDVLTSNTTYTYQMSKNDFDKSELGTYIISIVTWSTTPKYSLYAVSYTGNTIYRNLVVKIAGDDMTVTVENAVISVSGFSSNGGKISINALQ